MINRPAGAKPSAGFLCSIHSSGSVLSFSEALVRRTAHPVSRKDGIEEALFHLNRNLLGELSLALFDTTSFCFAGEGGEKLGTYGHSKDHRPDLHQVVVGALLTQDGWPLSMTVTPGNSPDTRALLPVVDQAKERFGLEREWGNSERGSRNAEQSVREGGNADPGTRNMERKRMN